MINAGDKVSFLPTQVTNKWYSGKVILKTKNPSYSYNNKHVYYIAPDDSTGLRQYMTELNTGDALKKLSSDDFDKISNIEQYGEAPVYMLYGIEGTNLKLEVSVSSFKSNHEDGCKCHSCKHFIQYAEPNRPDNTFICYSCTTNPIRQYY